MIKDIINQINASANGKEPERVPINIASNMFLNKDIFQYKMDHLCDMDEQDLANLVKHSYKSILTHIYDKTDMSYLRVFSNEKFLKILIQVLSAEPFLDFTYIKCCNKLAYDYLTYSNADVKIRNLFFSLSKIVNRNFIYGLYDIKITDELASYLVLARFSSKDESINVKRMNFILLQQDSNFFDLQTIVRVYEKLFNKARDLFIHTITDVYNFDDEMFVRMKEESPEKFKSFYNIYIAQTDAVITILNSMQFDEIIYILKEFFRYANYEHYTSDNIRYSLRSMAKNQDNFRVVAALEILEQKEKIYII